MKSWERLPDRNELLIGVEGWVLSIIRGVH